MKLPVIGIIVAAALLSAMASIAGGLVMYFESLSSLEDAVDATSREELNLLAEGILSLRKSVLQKAALMKHFAYNPPSLGGKGVEDAARAFQWSVLVSHPEVFEVAVIVIPRNRSDPAGPTYHATWASPTSNGTREYAFGTYSAAVANASGETNYETAADGTLSALHIPTYGLDPESGARGQRLYTWNAVSYINDLVPETWDPRSGDLPEEGEEHAGHRHGWASGAEYGAVAMKHRPPGTWWAQADNHTYIYGMHDVMFAPPPPPHPWADSQVVNFAVGFLYTVWEAKFDGYRSAHPDRTVFAVDTASERVYASTTGDRMLIESCTQRGEFSSVHVSECVLNVTALAPHHQRLFRSLQHAPAGTFRRWESDGVAYFQRKEWVFDDVELLWLRPVASVEKKVEDALVVLVLFTGLVLLFDALLAVMEVMLLARPLRDLDAAVEKIGRMETEEAGAGLRKYLSRRVMVREVDGLVKGMLDTLQELENFRSFLPASVLVSEGSAFDSENEEHLGALVASMQHEQGGGDCSTPGNMISEISLTSVGPGGAAPPLDQTPPGCQACKSEVMLKRGDSDERAVFALQLTQRRVSIAIFNVVGFAGLQTSKKDSEVVELHGALLDWLTTTAGTRRGLVDSFSGDRFFVSFNASKATVSHRASVAELGHSFAGYGKQAGLAVSGALVSGAAKVGNLGCRSMRKYSFISALLPFAHALERHARNLRVPVLCDDEVQREGLQKYYFRRAALFRVEKFNTAAVPIYWLTSSARTADPEEWMYELMSAEEHNPHKDWNAFVGAVLAGSWGEAAQLRGVLDGQDSVPLGPLHEVLRSALASYQYDAPDYSPYF